MDLIPKRTETYRHQSKKKQGQLVLVIVWGLFLCMNIFAENLDSLLTLRSLDFHWNSSPNYMSFFNMVDITEIHSYWFLVKSGHFIGFAIMNLLLYNLLGSYKKSIAITISFAVGSEVLQLFFGRDGRLYDVVIDSMGVLTEYYFLRKIRKRK
ncbi:VanZ family protein [Ectobacillus polymachus]|uniref:VanZ family protein n=1 Tax=Ectobacillus polymachus TaxID=1508806 RepID=UPI003A86E113